MKTAIVTGASTGLGLEFVRNLEIYFPEVERVWLIARNQSRLEEAASLLKRAQALILPQRLMICFTKT